MNNAMKCTCGPPHVFLLELAGMVFVWERENHKTRPGGGTQIWFRRCVESVKPYPFLKVILPKIVGLPLSMIFLRIYARLRIPLRIFFLENGTHVLGFLVIK